MRKKRGLTKYIIGGIAVALAVPGSLVLPVAAFYNWYSSCGSYETIPVDFDGDGLEDFVTHRNGEDAELHLNRGSGKHSIVQIAGERERGILLSDDGRCYDVLNQDEIECPSDLGR